MTGNVISRAVSIGTGIILARLLSPADYGTFTVALVALVLIANVNDLGLEPTIVRWPGDLSRVAPTAMTLIFGSSCLLFGFMFLLAPAFASALNASSAVGVVRLLAFGVVIGGAFAVPSALLTRSFRQGRRTVADVTGLAVTTGLTILLAVRGFGPWSLAWGRVVGNAVNSILHFLLAPARYRPGWDPEIARQLLRGSLPLAGTSLVAVAALNVDYMIVGRVLGPASLGFYLLAFNLSSWPVNMFSTAVAQVSVPAFARLQDNLGDLQLAFRRALRLLLAVSVPVAALVAALALPVVRFVYGARWAPAAAPLGFLALLGAIRVALQLVSDLLVATGRGHSTLKLQLLWLGLLAPGLAIGADVGGIRGVAIAHLFVAGAFMVPAFLFALRQLRIGVRDLASAAALPLAGALGASVAASVAITFVDGDIRQLAVGGVVGVLTYGIVLAPSGRTLLNSVRPAP